MPNADAQMAKLVDALVSGASAARLAGSSPVLGTKQPAIERLLVIFFLEQLFGWQVARIERFMRSARVLRFQWYPRDDFVVRVLFWAIFRSNRESKEFKDALPKFPKFPNLPQFLSIPI